VGRLRFLSSCWPIPKSENRFSKKIMLKQKPRL
jgi:hypothetical protein